MREQHVVLEGLVEKLYNGSRGDNYEFMNAYAEFLPACFHNPEIVSSEPFAVEMLESGRGVVGGVRGWERSDVNIFDVSHCHD